MDTVQNLRRKIHGAGDLKSIVRTMKAMAASNIGQYEMAVSSLGDYYRTIELGIKAFLREENIDPLNGTTKAKEKNEKLICAIVFGSDQGLVGQFNDLLAQFVSQSLNTFSGKKEIWAVGGRIQLLMSDARFNIANSFSVPNSVTAITPLVMQILINTETSHGKENPDEFYIYYNKQKSKAGYEPTKQRLLPLDEKWGQEFTRLNWPSKNLSQVVGEKRPTLMALIREYLFVSLFKACAESLASENASRLAAMQRAEKNIGEMLDELGHKFHNLRQSSIDEELFDVVSGFEALKKDVSPQVKSEY